MRVSNSTRSVCIPMPTHGTASRLCHIKGLNTEKTDLQATKVGRNGRGNVSTDLSVDQSGVYEYLHIVSSQKEEWGGWIKGGIFKYALHSSPLRFVVDNPETHFLYMVTSTTKMSYSHCSPSCFNLRSLAVLEPSVRCSVFWMRAPDQISTNTVHRLRCLRRDGRFGSKNVVLIRYFIVQNIVQNSFKELAWSGCIK